MKKVLIVLLAVVAVICICNEEPKKNTYTQEELWEAIAEAEYRAYKDGYAEGEYYAAGEYERKLSDTLDAAYEHGFETGYEYCLDEHGW